MTKESVHPCLREGKVLMEFEKGGIEVILGGVRAITPVKPVGTVEPIRADRGYSLYRGDIEG